MKWIKNTVLGYFFLIWKKNPQNIHLISKYKNMDRINFIFLTKISKIIVKKIDLPGNLKNCDGILKSYKFSIFSRYIIY